jgi:hypothetical protein
MTVGAQSNSASISQNITNLSVALRNLLQSASNLSLQINGTGTGLATLEAMGFGSTANDANPGSISDAAYALQLIGYLNTIAEIYYGDATQPATFDYNNALAAMWAGQ